MMSRDMVEGAIAGLGVGFLPRTQRMYGIVLETCGVALLRGVEVPLALSDWLRTSSRSHCEEAIRERTATVHDCNPYEDDDTADRCSAVLVAVANYGPVLGEDPCYRSLSYYMNEWIDIHG